MHFDLKYRTLFEKNIELAMIPASFVVLFLDWAFTGNSRKGTVFIVNFSMIVERMHTLMFDTSLVTSQLHAAKQAFLRVISQHYARLGILDFQ